VFAPNLLGLIARIIREQYKASYVHCPAVVN